MKESPIPELLSVPVRARVSAGWLGCLTEAGIATSWDIDAVDQKNGWLAPLEYYMFRRRIHIEGPCGFYGGLYGPNAWTAEGGLCTMGAASYSHSPLPEGLVVGRYCSLGKGLRFLDFAHPVSWLSTSVAFFRPLNVQSTSALAILVDRLGADVSPGFRRPEFDPRQGFSYPHIGHDVWIGESVALALGISIGTGAVIASGSIVTRDVPPYAVVAGVPAEVRRMRFSDDVVSRLLASEWWRYSYVDLHALDFKQPEVLPEQLAARVAIGKIQPWRPKMLVLPDDI